MKNQDLASAVAAGHCRCIRYHAGMAMQYVARRSMTIVRRVVDWQGDESRWISMAHLPSSLLSRYRIVGIGLRMHHRWSFVWTMLLTQLKHAKTIDGGKPCLRHVS